MNTAEKLRTGAIECACGRFYETMTGVNLCQENGHGSGKDVGFERYRFRQTVEVEFDVVCADCAMPIKFNIIPLTGSRTMIQVLAHVCQVDPEEEA